jgi:hypothetical protein
MIAYVYVADKIKSCGTGKGRRPWSAMEQQAVDRHLGKFLRTFKLPGRKDIDACLSAEPILAVNGRSWKNVKDYIRNRIVACKKVAK